MSKRTRPREPTAPAATHATRDHAAAAQIEAFKEAPRLFAGHRDYADEDAYFGVPPDGEHHPILAGWSPMTIAPRQSARQTLNDLAEQMFRQLKTCLKDGHGTSLH